MNRNIKSMKGISVVGILFVAMMVIFVVVLGMNIIPPYLQHYEVKDILDTLAKESNISQMNKGKVKDLFARRLQVNSIYAFKPESLSIDKKDGKVVWILNYEVRTHVFANIDVVIKFNDEVFPE